MNYYISVIVITILALCVLSVLVSENARISRKKKRLFIITNTLIAVSALAECAGVHISGNESVPSSVLAAVKTVDYILTPMTGGALIALMQTDETGKMKKRLWGIFAGYAIFQIISVSSGWMIVIDEHNNYTHGPLYPVYIVFYILIIINLLIKMISYGKAFRKQNRASLYAIILLVSAGVVMQEVMGDCRVAYLAAAFGTTMLFIHYSEFFQLRLDDEIAEQQVILYRDALTGVFSRFAYNDALEGFVSKNFATFLIDINGLKAVNDSIGHEAGDELICGAAECIENAFGKTGKVFRIGGDEFVVFTTISRERSKTVLNELKKNTDNWSGKRVKQLSLSVGCAFACDYEDISIAKLVEEADKTMYEQKKVYYTETGRNRRR